LSRERTPARDFAGTYTHQRRLARQGGIVCFVRVAEGGISGLYKTNWGEMGGEWDLAVMRWGVMVGGDRCLKM